MLTIDTGTTLRKAQAVGLLELLCQALELSETQFKLAEERYGAVGRWLGDADDAVLRSATIYPQGSVALGTTVKPIGRDEFDLDLVCLTVRAGQLGPSTLKKLIGDRLRLNGIYRNLLEEKPRCWRINYANEFHLDITPSIPNPACLRRGELVPDKLLSRWKPTNPKGYRESFEAYARLQARISINKFALAEARAQVESLPAPTRFKGLLRRCVQLYKRHRDVYFAGSDKATISIIITTLAAQSYAYCVSRTEYETEFDVLVDVVRNMPLFIERTGRSGERGWFVWNESTDGENFAEKWNRNPSLATAFEAWQRQAVQDFEQVAATNGMDQVSKHLTKSFGDVGTHAVRQFTDTVSKSRVAGQLSVTSAAGLVGLGTRGTQVRNNTFFGSDDE